MIAQELGGDLSTVKADTVLSYVEVTALKDWLGARLAASGPLTSRGKTKAMLTAFLSLLDRQVKLAQMIGLERRQRRVNPLDSVREAVRQANT